MSFILRRGVSFVRNKHAACFFGGPLSSSSQPSFGRERAARRFLSSNITTSSYSPFDYKESKFNSVVINLATAKAPDGDTALWASKLYFTIQHLKQERKAAIWLKIPIDFAHYIPICGHYGFRFHHTRPNFVMMVAWLPDQVANKVPAFATHHVGVAGCVINDNKEVLVVREKSDGPSLWKFPGGRAELGEDIGDAAMREVLEETGIKTEFKSVLTIRELHNSQFGNSDLYFICRMRPLGDTNIKICTHEIEEAVWMPLSQVQSQVQSHAAAQSSILRVVAPMLLQPEKVELTVSRHPSIDPTREPYSLYHHPLVPDT